jgi:hypothetical protein
MLCLVPPPTHTHTHTLSLSLSVAVSVFLYRVNRSELTEEVLSEELPEFIFVCFPFLFLGIGDSSVDFVPHIIPQKRSRVG